MYSCQDMKHITFTSLLLLLAAVFSYGQERSGLLNAEDSLAFENAEWQVTDLGKGAEAMYTQVKMFDSMQSICVIRYPARRFRTGFRHCPESEAGKTSVLAERAEADMAINGGYFDNGPVPCVYFRIGDETFSLTKPKEAKLRVNAVIGFKDRRGKKMMISRCAADEYEEVTGNWHSVMATGPLLVEDGDIVVPESYAKAYPERKTGDFYDGRHPRSIIGNDDDGNIYMIVIDGRHKDNADGTTIYQTALISHLLGLTDAINLDGGGSSALWSKETGVLNHPSDNRVFDHKGERTIPNIIGVF